MTKYVKCDLLSFIISDFICRNHLFHYYSVYFLKMNAEKYFKTRNLYEILEVSSDAQIQEGKNFICKVFLSKSMQCLYIAIQFKYILC